MGTELTHGAASQTVDLTGLPEAIVQRVKELVREARAASTGRESSDVRRGDSAEEWIAWWREMTASRPRLDGVTIDDSSESIYEDDGR